MTRIQKAPKHDASKKLTLLRILTPRQWQIAKFMAEGWTNPQIANELGIVVKVVDNQVTTIYQRAGYYDRQVYNKRVMIARRWIYENGFGF